MMRKWPTRYGLAAVITAALIISVAVVANPTVLPKVTAKPSLAIMLTDPPTVPAGTTVLNLTYSDISLHLTLPDNTSEWISVGSSGTVNSFQLVNMSQTIASTTVPMGSTVDKIQLNLVDVKALINGTIYNVTTLSNELVLSVANCKINQSLTGVLVDFNPTLVQTQTLDANGNTLNNYVLVSSARAMMVNSLDQAQVRVGTIVQLGENDRHRLTSVVQDFSQNLSIQSAALTVNGNSTSLSVTLKNNGGIAFRIFGITLEGQFVSPLNVTAMPQDGNFSPMNVIPFQINGTSLVPMFHGGPGFLPTPQQNLPFNESAPTNLTAPQFPAGPFGNFNQFGRPFMHGGPTQGFGPWNGTQRWNGTLPFGEWNGTLPLNTTNQWNTARTMNPQTGPFDDRNGNATSSYIALQPGQSITLQFNGIIAIPSWDNGTGQAISLTAGSTYTIGLMGEGFQTYTITAKT